MKKQKKSLSFLYFKINRTNNFYFLFYSFTFFLFLNSCKSNAIFELSQSITLLNGNILIIHNRGIDIYDSQLMGLQKNIVQSDNFINNETQLSKITISRFSEMDYGYIIATINDKIYIFDCEGTLKYNNSLEETELNGDYYTLIPIKKICNVYTFMVGFINNEKKIDCIFFKYNNSDNINIEKERHKYPYSYYSNNKNNSIEEKVLSCQLMNNHSKIDIIVCFIFRHEDKRITHFFIEINNYTMNIPNESKYINTSSSFFVKAIKSAITEDKKKSFVCFKYDDGPSYCTIYDIENNDYSNLTEYNNCHAPIYTLHIHYMRETEQFLLFCSKDGYVTVAIFNKNLNRSNNYTIYVGSNIRGISIIYSYFERNYYIISDSNENNNKNTTFLNFTEKINSTNPSIPNITSYIEKELQLKITTIISTILTDDINNSDFTTILASNSFISTQLQTTYPISFTTILTDDINNSIFTSVLTTKSPILETTYPSSFTTILNDDINNSTFITILTSNSFTSTQPLITYSITFSSNPTNSILNTDFPTNIISSDLSISSSQLIISTIITTYSELNDDSSAQIIPSSDPISHINSTYFLPSSIHSNSSINCIHEEIINITKENIIKELPSIIDNIEIGQIYKKIGDDYSILIYPTNSTYLTTLTHVDFSECEAILRNHYHLPESSIMTFLQIEIENDNSKSLINQVEYQAFDGNKTFLDLSLCENVNIQVIYSIKNKSLVDFDKEKAIYFKQSGIDIFSINDSFFNDICEPYSESDNDLILEDRIKDIYQNYSLCEEGCVYDKIDLEILTITCECKVKENISTIIKPIQLEHSEGSSTNFDIIKCYKLVFSLKGKLNNICFWIFSILVFAHIPILIYYFLKGVKPIKIYIFKEMEKYGYIKYNKSIKEVNNNKNKRKIINKTHNNLIYKKNSNKSTKVEPPKKNNKNIKNNNNNNIKNKNNKQKYLIIKNIKIVDNSSSLKILNSTNRGIIPGSNHNKKKGKTMIQINKKNQNLNNNITNLPTQTINHNKHKIIDKSVKNKKLKEYNLINIDLNLSRNEEYIPPDSHIILNNYTFEEASEYDLREVCVLFYIFALSKQIVFHTFLFRSPIELFSLRLILFIFIFSCDLALNSLFYFNDNISKKYRFSKNIFIFAFSDNITVVLLSYFVGFILLTFLAKLSNSTNDIREIFRKEEEKLKKNKKYIVTKKRKNEIICEIEEILKKYQLKIIILIIIEIILMIFFWYFVTAFGHVYKATQKSWLIDSLLTILIRAIIELLICLGLAKLYRMAVYSKIYCLYKIVMFIYNFS